MGSRPALRCQGSGSVLKHQVRLITHAKKPKDLTRLVFLSKSSTSLNLQLCLALWEKGTLSLLVSDVTHLRLDGMIPNGFHVYPRLLRGLGLEGDTWKGTPPQLLYKLT